MAATGPHRSAEAVEPRRVVDQDPVAHRGVGSPFRQLVEDPPIINQLIRGDFLSRTGAGGAGVGPVRPPQNAVWVRLNERLGERRGVGEIGRALGDAVGARDLHIGLAGARQLKQRGKAGLFDAQLGPGAAEMNEDQRHRRVHQLILERIDGGELDLGLHMPPVVPRDPLHRVLQPARRCRRVHGAADRQVHMDAADASLVHLVELGVRGLLVDNDDTAGALRAELADGVELRAVVRAIDAGLYDDDAVQTQEALQLHEIVGRRKGRGVDAVRREGEPRGIGKDVGVAVAGPTRDIEVDRSLVLHRRPGAAAGQDRRGPGGSQRPRVRTPFDASAWLTLPQRYSGSCFRSRLIEALLGQRRRLAKRPRRALASPRSRPIRASRLHGPGPANTRYRNTQQYRMAASPPLSTGNRLRGACAIQYATAISPASRKATGRVNRPSRRSGPPTSSSRPAIQDMVVIEAGLGWGGKPSSFWVPCRRKIRAATMRRMLSTRGAHSEKVSVFMRRFSLDPRL